MGFGAPWLLLGLAAIAVPVMVHLVRREDRQGRGFPSLMFLERVPFEVRSRRRLRDRVLLMLRLAALAALVLAFAGPSCPRTGASARSGASHDLVVVLDRSYSMASSARWASAKDAVRERLGRLGGGARVALVIVDDAADVAMPLSPDRASLLARIDRLEPGVGGTRLAGALRLAHELLRRGGAEKRSIVLVSDLQRSALSENARLRVDPSVELDVQRIADPVTRNAALLDARLMRPQAERPDDTLRVRVANTGREALTDLRLSVLRDGHREAPLPAFELAPGEVRALTVPVVLAADRHTRIELRLTPDELAADNRFHVALPPRRPVSVALVSAQPRREDRGVFVEEALRLLRAPAIQLTEINVRDLSDIVLAPFAVAIVDDVAVPAGAPARALAAFVTSGGGVLAALGPDSDDWPPSLRGVMPGRPGRVLRTPSARLARAGGSDGETHPLWSLAGRDAAGLFPAARINSVRTVAIGDGDTVLARLDAGAPLMVAREAGAGRALAIATTLDARWSSLALEPGFVAFVGAAVKLLADRPGVPEALTTGQSVDVATRISALDDGDAWRAHRARGGELVVERPDGRPERLAPARWVFGTRAPGLYEVHRAGGSAPLPVAVNVDRRESLLGALQLDEFSARVERRAAGGADRPRVRDRNAPETRSVAWWLLVLAAMLLLVESMLARHTARPAASG